MTNYEQQCEVDAKPMAEQISHYLNTFGHDHCIKALVKEIDLDHRTLQQTFTKLCVMWLEHCGHPDYRYDGRNDASHKLGEAFQTLPENVRHLPFI